MQRKEKAPYQTPKLQMYGSLTEMTKKGPGGGDNKFKSNAMS
jgi:hypothetical protein